MPDPWYPPAADYFVPRDTDDAYPVRQGDVFAADGVTGDQAEWAGFLLTHPTCEIRKAPRLQVARLRRVSDLSDEFQRTLVTYGYRDRGGEIDVAFAHTFWLPPAGDALDEPLFADFRDTATVEPGRMRPETRTRAMSHEARLYLIRRMILFRFRWMLSIEDVRGLEADRIGRDPAFEGPRPDWAPAS